MLAMPERGTVGRKKPLEAADFGGAGAGNGRTRQARVRGWPLERPRRLCRPWSPADQSVGRSCWMELCQLAHGGGVVGTFHGVAYGWATVNRAADDLCRGGAGGGGATEPDWNSHRNRPSPGVAVQSKPDGTGGAALEAHGTARMWTGDRMDCRGGDGGARGRASQIGTATRTDRFLMPPCSEAHCTGG